MVIRLDGRAVLLIAPAVGQDHFCPALFLGQGGADGRLGGAAGAPADLRLGGHGGDIAVPPAKDFLA